MSISGWILLDKPAGISSRAAGGRVARMFGAKTFGHLGTLDPMADGLLPIALGQATKMIPYLESLPGRADKEYDFSVRWGYRTDTLDAYGREVARDGREPEFNAVDSFCDGYHGEIDQVPPAYSAIHVNGVRAYQLAVSGNAPDLPPRRVVIHDLVLAQGDKGDDGKTSVSVCRVRCSSGTYVRAIARDMGEMLGGYLCTVDMIRRNKTHGFDVSDAIKLENLEKLYNNDHDSFLAVLRPVDFGLDDIPVFNLNDTDAKLFKNGGFISVADESAGTRRVYCNDQFIGIGFNQPYCLKPLRILI